MSTAEYQREWRRKNPTKGRYYSLRFRYGITVEQYDALLLKQNGVCALCGKVPAKQNKRNYYLHVDHCHETNTVRGLLCFHCNSSLGKLGDTTEKLQKVLDYISCPS